MDINIPDVGIPCVFIVDVHTILSPTYQDRVVDLNIRNSQLGKSYVVLKLY